MKAKYDSIYYDKNNIYYILRCLRGMNIIEHETLISLRSNHPTKLCYFKIHLLEYPTLIPYLEKL